MSTDINNNPELKQAIIELFKLAQSLPKSEAAKEYERKIDAGEIIRCPHTGKEYESALVETIDDPIGGVYNLIHPSERANLIGLCAVICIQCRQVVAWMSPDKDKDGFKREKDMNYHIYCCPNCEPEKFKDKEVVTELIEKQLYNKHVKKKS